MQFRSALHWIDTHPYAVVAAMIAWGLAIEVWRLVHNRLESSRRRELLALASLHASEQQAERYRAAYERERIESEKWRAVANVRRGR